MAIQKIFSFLVQPAKGLEDQPDISGTGVPLRGPLFDLIGGLYDTADANGAIDIVFSSQGNGQQENVRRTQILDYLTQPTLPNARHLARALQAVTDKRSGLGLLFIASGVEDDQTRIVLSRFPANQGILATEDARTLTVEFLERVFMKSAHAYKSAAFIGASFDKGEFWTGRAVDKQINPVRDLPRYWIGDFLQAELLSTPAAGTKRFVQAVSDAVRDTDDPMVRAELVAVTTLLANQDGKEVTPEGIAADLLSPAATAALLEAMPRPEVFGQAFEVDAQELADQARYRMLELDNGAILMAVNARFEEVFVREVQGDDGTVRFSTIGKVVDTRLRKAKL